jgi:hypothetical protein
MMAMWKAMMDFFPMQDAQLSDYFVFFQGPLERSLSKKDIDQRSMTDSSMKFLEAHHV